MVSAKEKRDFFEIITENMGTPVPSMEVQHRLHELLLRDTQGGKLYKYRAFDPKGYALKNLRDGTLHCSPPDVFNDPFDCKIGITFNSLYEAMYGEEFELIAEVFSLFTNVVDGSLSIDVCNEDEQRIIRSLLESKKLVHFVAEYRGKAKTEEEMAQILQDNVGVILELLQIVLADEVFSCSLRICASMMPKIMECITPEGMLLLSNDNATFEDYAKANGVMDDTDEIGLTMLLSTKLRPELAGAVEGLQNLIDEMERKVADKMGRLFLIGCLCTNPKNRLMWSHYADSHKGFCVEYDFSGTDEDTLSKLPLPIIYTEERPLVPWKAALDNTKENIDAASAQLMLGLLTKDRDWEYENEWRILIGAAEASELKMPPVTCIYLGVAIEEQNRKEVLKIAKQLGIPVKQMKVDRGAYALHAEEVAVD